MTSIKLRLSGVALSVLVASSSAVAQPLTPDDDEPVCENPEAECPPVEAKPAAPPPPAPEPYIEPAPIVEVAPMAEETWLERVGLGFAVGGGVDDFASSEMEDTTGTGGSWNVRATLGTRTYLAGEASYIGSAQSIDALGLDNDAVLIGNGLQGALRLNATTDYGVQPFAYGGMAWRRYDLTNEDFNTSAVSSSDDVFEIPMGIGIGGYLSGFMVDVRGEYRWATGEDMVPDFSDDGIAEMDRWGLHGSVGYAF